MVVAIDKWSLFGGGRKLRFDCSRIYLFTHSIYIKKTERRFSHRRICYKLGIELAAVLLNYLLVFFTFALRLKLR
jgi:hypothetical protein